MEATAGQRVARSRATRHSVRIACLLTPSPGGPRHCRTKALFVATQVDSREKTTHLFRGAAVHDMTLGGCVCRVDGRAHQPARPYCGARVVFVAPARARPLGILTALPPLVCVCYCVRRQTLRENADRHSGHNSDVKRDSYEGLNPQPDVCCKLGGFLADDGVSFVTVGAPSRQQAA